MKHVFFILFYQVQLVLFCEVYKTYVFSCFRDMFQRYGDFYIGSKRSKSVCLSVSRQFFA